MRVPTGIRPLSVLVAILVTATSFLRAQRQPDCQTGCLGSVQISAWTFTPVTQPPDGGPFTYTVTILNPTLTTSTFTVECIQLAIQLPCITPSPSNFSLGPSETQDVTVGYTTKGLGAFSQRILAQNDADDIHPVTKDFGKVTVKGAAIGTVMFPAPGGQVTPNDTILGSFYHSSGVNSTSFQLFIDGADFTNDSHVHKTSSTIWESGLTLGVQTHTVGLYGCAVNGRCDTIPKISFIAIGAPSTFGMDDSLPLPTSAQGGYSGTLPGALPLPAVNLRGCPVNVDEPLIQLQSPTGSVSQGGTTPGLIFVPSVSYDTALVVATLNHDYKDVDNTTCTDGVHFVYLNEVQYDWKFWIIQQNPETDSMWAGYPFGDCVQCGHNPNGGMSPMLVGGPQLSASLVTSRSLPGAEPGGRRGPIQPWQPFHPVFPHIQGPGAINPSTFTLKLNGTLIVNNDQVVAGYTTYVTKVNSDLTGQTYRINQSISLMNRYDPLNPAAGNGWNTLEASIADSTNHRSTVQTRFIQVKPLPPLRDLPLTALKDFRWLNQGDCAAFGIFQCGSVMVTQTIPGFVTRDKDRSLHLVYQSASQRAPTIIPYQLTVGAFQATPDSVWVFAKEGTTNVGDTIRYVGGKKPATDPDTVATLWNFTYEKRVQSSLLNAPTDTSRVKIRSITSVVRAFYSPSTIRDNTVNVTQEVVQLYRSDTVMARFGQGWTLAEQSRLFLVGLTSQGAQAVVWYEGDGSYTIFRLVNNVWVSPTGETARLYDNVRTPGLLAPYVIALSNGATIGFTATGWQQFTTDLIGNQTTYGYAGNRLISITDPSGMYYEFQYNYASGGGLGQVSDIILHGIGGTTAKIATMTYNSAGRLAQVKIYRNGTAGDSTRFGYLTRSISRLDHRPAFAPDSESAEQSGDCDDSGLRYLAVHANPSDSATGAPIRSTVLGSVP
jgi:hypothetical protein